MSLCDKCFDPGRCCKRLHFYADGGQAVFWLDIPFEFQMREARPEEDRDRPIPFVVESIDQRFKTPDMRREYAHMTFRCTALLPDGRCGIYQDRPWLCRVFEPGVSDGCVHFRGAEGSEA